MTGKNWIRICHPHRILKVLSGPNFKKTKKIKFYFFFGNEVVWSSSLNCSAETWCWKENKKIVWKVLYSAFQWYMILILLTKNSKKINCWKKILAARKWEFCQFWLFFLGKNLNFPIFSNFLYGLLYTVEKLITWALNWISVESRHTNFIMPFRF